MLRRVRSFHTGSIGLKVKGLQDYRSSKFENDLIPSEVESELNVLAHSLTVKIKAAHFPKTFKFDT